MKIATYNVNGVNGRLPNLLAWLGETSPDVVCLQELKAPQEKFPIVAIGDAGYDAIWHGQKSWNGVAILTRGTEATESRRVLPGDPEDLHSRYIEAAIGGIVVGASTSPTATRRRAQLLRLQAPRLRSARATRQVAPGLERARGPRRRLQCHAHRSRRVQAGEMGQ